MNFESIGHFDSENFPFWAMLNVYMNFRIKNVKWMYV